MAFTLTPVLAKDSAGSAIGGGLKAADIAGGGVGPFFIFHGLIDGVAGVNVATIDSTNAQKVFVASSGIASGAIASGALATGAFASGSIASGAIASGAFASGSIGSGAVASGAFASGSIGSGAVASGAVASGAFASGSIASGAVASGAIASGAIASGAVASGAFASGSISDGAVVTLGAKTDAKSAATDATSITIMQVEKQISASVQSLVTAIGSTAWDLGSGTSGTRTQRVIVDSSQFTSLGQATMANSQPVTIASNQSGLGNRGISAAFSTLTRPANTTPYAALDSISDNGTAGSVTALTGTFSDVNDDPIFISEILISSTDTGLAGKRIRAYLYNSDPTASSGVGGGDNAAFSQKKAGYIGGFSGVLEAGFSDGTVGRLVPAFNDGAAASTPNASAGGFVVTKPTSGAKTLYIQYQAIDGFTPSANSTTIIGTARGWQARAA